MASTRQLKHHARFHAAVLRYLFPPSPRAHADQDAPESLHEANFQFESPESTKLVIEETETAIEEAEAARTSSRAQRKRFKTKKLKEAQLDALPAKRFIGPLRRLESDESNLADALLQEITSFDKSQTLSSSKGDQDFEEVGRPELPSSMMAADKLAKGMREEAVPSLLETGKGKSIHDGAELELLSRVKRRRLAKKKFHDSSRCLTAGSSSFTAEMKGKDIIIKPIL